MKRLSTAVTLVALMTCSPIAARADVVLDWNQIAISTLVKQGQSPFAQARFMAITQLAVFEAVNAITGDYQPYLGTVVAPAGASADAAAVTAAHDVLKHYFPLAAPTLDAAYAASLAAIPDGSAKNGGIATGQAAAAQMIAARVGDGSSPAQFYVPTSVDPGVWSSRQAALRQAVSIFSGRTSRRSAFRACPAARRGLRRSSRVRPRRSRAVDTRGTTTK